MGRTGRFERLGDGLDIGDLVDYCAGVLTAPLRALYEVNDLSVNVASAKPRCRSTVAIARVRSAVSPGKAPQTLLLRHQFCEPRRPLSLPPPCSGREMNAPRLIHGNRTESSSVGPSLGENFPSVVGEPSPLQFGNNFEISRPPSSSRRSRTCRYPPVQQHPVKAKLKGIGNRSKQCSSGCRGG